MKDLNLGRLINTVAFGSLTASVGGCLGGGSGSSSGSSSGSGNAQRIATSYCAAAESCNPQGFGDVFSSAAECEEYLIDEYDYARDEYGADCAVAGVDFYDCFATAYAELCEPLEAYYECESEYSAFNATCGFDSSGEY